MILLATALYWIAVGTLAFAAAASIALLLRRRGRQERAVWALGLVAAVVLPLFLPDLASAPASVLTSAGEIEPVGAIDLAPLRIGVAESTGTAWLGPSLLALWAVLSGVLLVRFMASLQMVRRIRDHAGVSELGIRVADAHGPAVVGFLRPEVLVPSWVLRLPQAQRDWILRHEHEHVRGRDPMLLAFLIATRIILPWNPVVWAFGLRLRTAIETDCDRRTLGERGDPRSYGEALLSVAGGPRDAHPLPALAPAFAERHVALDHRIETLARPRRSLGMMVSLAVIGVVVMATAVACEVPAPTEAPEAAPEAVPTPSDARAAAGGEPPSPGEGRFMRSDTPDTLPVPEYDAPETTEGSAAPAPPAVEDGPRFIPYDTPPRMKNASEVQAVLSREYPPVLKEAGIGGLVNVWLLVGTDGAVEQTQVNETSGYDALDAAALRVADAMTFEPAMNRDRATSVWVSIPVTFTVGRL